MTTLLCGKFKKNGIDLANSKINKIKININKFYKQFY